MNRVIHKLRGSIMAELNESIIKWINELPNSDQEALEKLDVEMDLLVDLLKEGREYKILRELYRKISDALDKEDAQE